MTTALDLPARLPDAWRALLAPHLDSAATAALGEFVAAEYAQPDPRWTTGSPRTGCARRSAAAC
jgi:hypothetical protein